MENVWRLHSEERFWSVLRQLMMADAGSPMDTARTPEFQELAAEYFPTLVDCFGPKRFVYNLAAIMGDRQFRETTRLAYPDRLPSFIRRPLLKSKIAKFFRKRLRGTRR